MDKLAELVNFIMAREAARRWHAAGKPEALYERLDPIIRAYRFCNINREDDKVTRWIDANVRRRWDNDSYLWFALIICRLINQPSTLHQIFGIWPDGTTRRTCYWDADQFLACTDPADPTNEQPIWNAAYIVSTNGRAMDKREYIATHVLQSIWDKRLERPSRVTQPRTQTCQEWADWLLQFDGMGDFMVNQIVTDYKYCIHLCADAKDRSTFAMAGPGTIRGLNRYYGRPVDKSLNRAQAQAELLAIREETETYLPTLVQGYFQDLNNLSNTFCEFDKYLRAKTGDGRPKQLYRK